MMPGMQVEKEDSDSDPEAVAARKGRKMKAIEKSKEEELRQQKEQEAKKKYMEEMADVEQLLPALACKRTDMEAFMSSIECTKPEAFEERLTLGGELSDKGKALLQDDAEKAGKYFLAALHCLDLTPRQQGEQPIGNRTRLLQAVVLNLERLSYASYKLNDASAALRAANIGMEVVSKLPYKDSKDFRIKIRVRRALAMGARRDFEGALGEAKHILMLSPDHEQGRLLKKNSSAAIKREVGPLELRWKGSLLAPGPKTEPQKSQKIPTMALVSVGVVAVGCLALRFFPGATAEMGPLPVR